MVTATPGSQSSGTFTFHVIRLWRIELLKHHLMIRRTGDGGDWKEQLLCVRSSILDEVDLGGCSGCGFRSSMCPVKSQLHITEQIFHGLQGKRSLSMSHWSFHVRKHKQTGLFTDKC